MDGRGESRIAIVLEVHPKMYAIGLMFTSNLVENASDLDLHVHPADIGLPFGLIAETDIQSTAWKWQLGGIGDPLPDDLFDELAAISRRRPTSVSGGRRGAPLSGPKDPRWTWKESEADEIARLTGDCVGTLLDPPRLDLGPLVLPDTWLARELIAEATEALSAGVAVVAPADVMAFEGSNIDDLMLDNVGSEAFLAIQPALLSAVAQADAGSNVTDELTTIPAREIAPADDPLRRLEHGRSTVRLATWPQLWNDDGEGVLATRGSSGRIVRILREPLTIPTGGS
jgi:hypothetical protein